MQFENNLLHDTLDALGLSILPSLMEPLKNTHPKNIYATRFPFFENSDFFGKSGGLSSVFELFSIAFLHLKPIPPVVFR